MRRRRVIALALTLTLAFVSMSFKCDGDNSNTPESLKRKYAKLVDDMAGAINAAIKAKRQLAQQGRITPAEELKLTNALIKLNDAVTTLNNKVKPLTVIDDTTKPELMTLRAAVTSALDELVPEAINSISNEDARNKLLKIVATIRATLAAISALT